MRKKKDICVAGCGAIAKEHLKALRSIDSVEVVALCDISEEAVNRASKEWNVKRAYTSFSEMLEKENVSIVSILTPPQIHASMAIEAIRSGKNVLVEKPLTMTTEDARLIIDALAESDVKLTVNYNALTGETMMKALDLVKRSSVGEVLGAEVRMLHATNDPMASDEKHWCHRLPGGRFGEMLAHPVYLLQSVLGDSLRIVKIITAKRGTFDWMPHDELYVLLEGDNKIGRIYVSFNTPRPAYQIDLYGTQKIVNVDLLNGTLLSRGQRTYSKIDSAIDSLSIASDMLFQTIQNTLTYLQHGIGERALQRTYLALLNSIEGTGEVIVTPSMAYNTVKIVEEICSGI